MRKCHGSISVVDKVADKCSKIDNDSLHLTLPTNIDKESKAFSQGGWKIILIKKQKIQKKPQASMIIVELIKIAAD